VKRFQFPDKLNLQTPKRPTSRKKSTFVRWF
jgi:hypothetical protein